MYRAFMIAISSPARNLFIEMEFLKFNFTASHKPGSLIYLGQKETLQECWCFGSDFKAYTLLFEAIAPEEFNDFL